VLHAALRGLFFAKLATLGWQALVFLRTDLYAVLLVATGCRNLWRVKTLLLRRAFGRLSPAERGELDRANPRDLAVGSWFRWVWLGGFGVGMVWLVAFYVPFMAVVLAWAADGLATGPGDARFWYRLIVLALVFWPHAALAVAALRDLIRRPGGDGALTA
jgi:hypothetical protein